MRKASIPDRTDELLAEISRLSEEVAGLRGEATGLRRTKSLTDEIDRLREQITTLKVEKSRLDEANARERREVEHMVGLDRKRAEHDRAHAIREATLGVREANLSAEIERFERETDFRESRFAEQIDYLKSLMGQILERLPTITVKQGNGAGSE